MPSYKDPVGRKQYLRAYQREWRTRRRTLFFADKVCVKCGSRDDLELDHFDPSQKIDHRVWSWSEERRNEELVKCQVLCQKCHQHKTLSERTPEGARREHGTQSMYRFGCRCGACRYGNSQARKRHNGRGGAIRQSATEFVLKTNEP